MRAGKESARERKFIVGKGGQRYDGRNSLSNLDLTVLVRFIRIPEPRSAGCCHDEQRLGSHARVRTERS